MIELFVHMIILQAIFRFNISANTLPWNTTLSQPGNFTQAPNLIKQNIPWFFPLITLVLLLGSDYVLGLKKGIETKSNFFAVALVYTFLSYIEVVGQLSTSGWFYIFEFIMLASVFILTLFAKGQEQG